MLLLTLYSVYIFEYIFESVHVLYLSIEDSFRHILPTFAKAFDRTLSKPIIASCPSYIYTMRKSLSGVKKNAHEYTKWRTSKHMYKRQNRPICYLTFTQSSRLLHSPSPSLCCSTRWIVTECIPSTWAWRTLLTLTVCCYSTAMPWVRETHIQKHACTKAHISQKMPHANLCNQQYHMHT